MKDYKDKVAVITGAGRGIGRGIALHCAQKGMRVVLAGIGLESVTDTAAAIESLGRETLVVQTDVSKLEDVKNLAEQSFNAFGAVDLLVNNAGVAMPAPLLESTIDDWNWVMGVNFFGVLYGVHAFAPRMVALGTSSHIVNVSSLAGIYPTGSSYSVSKSAVFVFTESLYMEMARTAPQVKISVFCPGWVNTDFDSCARSRPERFRGSMASLSAEKRASWRASLSKGVSPAETARILFDGLQEEKLYIGPKSFQFQEPRLADGVRLRTENILNERNP